MGENPFPSKTYHVNGREYRQRPLSFFEALEIPELIIGIMEKIPEGAAVTGPMIASYAKDELQGILCRVLDVDAEELRAIPADTGMQIVADFMEMNLNENFINALRKAMDAGRRIYSELVKS